MTAGREPSTPATGRAAGPPFSGRGRALSLSALRLRGSPWDVSPPPSPITRAPGRPMARGSSPRPREARLDRSQRLLDIGAGPGILAIGFAPYCGEVSASIRSLRWSRPHARRRRARASLRHSSRGVSRTRAASLGVFDVVTIGRAIHWLDPAPARAALDRVVKPRGRILVCHAGSVEDGRNPWLDAFKAVRDRWKDDRPAYDPNAFFAGGRFVPAGRSASKRPIPFPSNGSPTESCRCPPRRRRGSATKCPR